MGLKVLVYQDVVHKKKYQNGKGFKWDEAYTLDGMNTQGIAVSGQMSGTDTPIQSTKDITKSATLEMSGQLKLMKYQTINYSVQDFLASLSVLLESGEVLTKLGELSFLKSQGFYPTSDPNIYCLKTSKVYFLTTLAKLSKSCLGFLPTWGMTVSGKCLTAKISPFPRIGSASSLSDILEPNPSQKYYLSRQTIDRLLKFGIRLVKKDGIAGTLKARTGGPQNDERYLLDDLPP
jgi:hypothetical protein